MSSRSKQSRTTRARLGGLCQVVLLAWLMVLGNACGVSAEGQKELFAKVFPDATRFGLMSGKPPVAPAYKGEDVAGYIFFTRLVIRSVGYTGKPLNVLVGLGVDGLIKQALLIDHAEPILAIGVSDADLENFIGQYAGRDIRDAVKVSRGGQASPEQVVAISGASISSVVLNDIILRSARTVARAKGILGGPSGRIDLEGFEPLDWQDLLADNSLLTHRLSVGDATAQLFRRGANLFPPGIGPSDGNATYIEMFIGLATPARIGRNLIGERRFNRIAGGIGAGDQLLFIGANGLYSFKGRAYRKTGLFDRIQLVQADRTFRFTSADHIRVNRLKIAEAPQIREGAFFVIRSATGFNPVAPWRLDLLYSGDRQDGGSSYATTSLVYQLPEHYLRSQIQGAGKTKPLWWQIWEGRLFDITVLILVLVALTALLVVHEWVVLRKKYFPWVRNGVLLFTLVWLGWYTNAQLSVINLLAFTESLLTGFSWDFLLLEPLIFVLWGYAVLTLIFWGRGVFCGWLCPFGALQELLNKLAQWARLPQYRLPFGLGERLWSLKYVIFVGLFAISLGSQDFAQLGAEVEPFKTAIILGFQRAAYFIAYAGVVLLAGLFVERFFCRYLCPLGAALALPARLHMFDWLKRRWQCGIQCSICADRCPVQAIHPDGHINPNECIHCLNCQVHYSDDQTCPPLAEEKKRKDSRLTRRLVELFETAESKAGGETPEDERK